VSILAQCGHFHGDKLSKGLNAGILRGAVLSPRNLEETELLRLAGDVRKLIPTGYLLMDPQFHAVVVPEKVARLGRLQTYSYYPPHQGLSRIHFAPTEVRTFTKSVLDFQANKLGSYLTHYVAPTVLLNSLDDFWSQIALDLASEAVEYTRNIRPSRPLLIMLVMTEQALSDRSSVEDFIDAVTSYDAAGFYVVVDRGLSRAEYSLRPKPLGHLMYLCHVLAEKNEYVVVAGYEDIESILLHAAGITVSATGWSRGIRAFHLENLFVQEGISGGRSPRSRYTSRPLLSTVKLSPEIRDIDKAGHLDKVLCGGNYDAQLKSALVSSTSSWDRTTEALQHWDSLHHLVAKVRQRVQVEDRIDTVIQLINDAVKCHNTLKGVTIGLTSAHLEKWVSGVQVFRDIAGIKRTGVA